MPIERASADTSVIDVLDRVLDKGIVIDVLMRVSLVGIALVTVEARVIVASIETFFRYSDVFGAREPTVRIVKAVEAQGLSVEVSSPALKDAPRGSFAPAEARAAPPPRK